MLTKFDLGRATLARVTMPLLVEHAQTMFVRSQNVAPMKTARFTVVIF